MTDIILENIKALCELKGITVVDLAKALGIGDRYFLKPHDDLSVILVAKVADYFGVWIGSLCKEEFTKQIKAQIIQGEIRRLSKELADLTPAEN